MKVILPILIVILLSGCANKIHLQCPDCTVTNDKFACTGCTVDATEVKFSGEILEALPPIKE